MDFAVNMNQNANTMKLYESLTNLSLFTTKVRRTTALEDDVSEIRDPHIQFFLTLHVQSFCDICLVRCLVAFVSFRL